MLTSFRRAIFRLLSISPFVFLVVSACSHTPDASRGIAMTDTVRTSSESAVNRKGVEGAYDVEAEAHYPLGEGRTFANIVAVFREVAISTEISNQLTTRKAKPLNKVRISATNGTPSAGYNLAYVINGYPEGHPGWGDQSKVNCHDNYAPTQGKGVWIQDCEADLKYEETAKYLREFKQTISCTESGAAVDCKFRSTGIVKPITFNFIMRAVLKLLFGASEYSATQAAHLTVQNILHGTYAASELLKRPAPFTKEAVKAAVDHYASSEAYAGIDKFKEKFPSSMKDASSVVFAGPN